MKNINKLLLCVLLIWIFFPWSNLLAQKPRVAAVVWDEKSKEGQDLGEIRIYQLGEPIGGLHVKIQVMPLPFLKQRMPM